MTPKEKAKELILKFAFKGAQHEGEAKRFALIAVDETVDGLKQYLHSLYQKQELTSDEYTIQAIFVEYYRLVKEEIEKL